RGSVSARDIPRGCEGNVESAREVNEAGFVDLDQLALRQLDDYRRGRHGLLFADASVALTIADAYQLQRRVGVLRESSGEAVAGYKIGCVSEVVRAQLGLDRPVFGHIFETEVHRSGCQLPESAFSGMAIEGEYALRLSRDFASVASLKEDAGQA